jgi:hypothetical protein
MPSIRVTSDGPGALLGAALLPVPAAQAQGYQSWGPVVGEPSRSRISAPVPVSVPQGVRYRNDGAPLHSSSDAPQFWNPGIYYQPVPQAAPGNLVAGPGMAIESDNQMPVPAGTPRGKPAVMARQPTFLRQRQVGWPITTPMYRWRA